MPKNPQDLKHRSVRLGLVLLACLVPGAAGAQAELRRIAEQQGIPLWRVDPYTANDPEAMAKAGYVSFGPFPFGDRHTSEDVDELLVSDNIIWIETRHFRFGTSLEDFVIPPDPETRAKLMEELTRLSRRLPRVNPRTIRRLDPWLRAHLFAMRLEEIYSEFLDVIGHTTEDFPPDPDELVIGGKFMGYGPYLGQKDKYLLLVTEKAGSYGLYLNRFIGKPYLRSQRWNFKERGSLFFGTAADLEDRRLRHDTAMHSHVAYGITVNLVDGYKHYSYDIPIWLRIGLGHWFSRRVSTRYPSFEEDEGHNIDKKSTWSESDIRRLVQTGRATPFSEMGRWREFADLTFNDHIVAWSRVDFLIGLDRTKFGRFLEKIVSRVDPETWIPDGANLPAVQRNAMQEVYDLNAFTFDEQWREHVLRTYAAR